MTDPEKIVKTPARIFNIAQVLLIAWYFWCGMIVLNGLVRWIRGYIDFDCTDAFPMSVFYVEPWDVERWLRAGLALAIFWIILLFLKKILRNTGAVILAGIVILIASTYIQGFYNGFLYPIIEEGISGQQYFHDALKITNPLHFLSSYTDHQHELFRHSQTHPPGAVLFIYWLGSTLYAPYIVSTVIGIFTTLFSALFLQGIISREIKNQRETVAFTIFLFLLIPAIQVFYLASVDAVIATFMLGALYFFLHENRILSIIGTTIFLFAASTMTFAILFLIPVLLGYQYLREKNIAKTLVILILFFGLWLIVDYIFGFNYLLSLTIATQIENPMGFRLLHDPASYIFTRLEDVLDIFLFFGPFLGILAWRGVKILRGNRDSGLWTLTLLGFWTIIAMFVAGAFRTGETARAALFIYPYLMLPVSIYLGSLCPTMKEMRQLAWLVFSHTVFMQLLGSHFW